MAFPQTLNPAVPANTDSPKFGAAEIRTNKQFLMDVFGFPSAPTTITQPAFNLNNNSQISVLRPAYFLPGSAALPGIAFAGSGFSTGLFNSSPTILDIAAGGSRSANFTAPLGAVNYVNVNANVAGFGPAISAQGLDASISFALQAKGPAGQVQLWTNSANRWVVDGSGNLFPGSSGAYDIGASANQVRDFFMSRDAYIGNVLRMANGAITGVTAGSIVMANNAQINWVDAGGTTVAATGMYLNTIGHQVYQIPNQANYHAFLLGGAEFLNLYAENSGAGIRFFALSTGDHTNPAADKAEIYTTKVAGKVRIMARFPTGAAQLVASEP